MVYNINYTRIALLAVFFLIIFNIYNNYTYHMFVEDHEDMDIKVAINPKIIKSGINKAIPLNFPLIDGNSNMDQENYNCNYNEGPGNHKLLNPVE